MPVIQSLRKNSNMTFDVHLMIEDPDRYLDEFAAIGADILTVHAEACTHLDRTIQKIHQLGKKAGVALNRKVLADLAVRQKEDFAKLVELAKTKLA